MNSKAGYLEFLTILHTRNMFFYGQKLRQANLVPSIYPLYVVRIEYMYLGFKGHIQNLVQRYTLLSLGTAICQILKINKGQATSQLHGVPYKPHWMLYPPATILCLCIWFVKS